MKNTVKKAVTNIVIKTTIVVAAILFVIFKFTSFNDDIGDIPSKYVPRQKDIFTDDFPDPTGLFYNNKYYAYSTSSGNTAIPVAISDDNKRYEVIDNALLKIPDWTNGGLWAPDVFYNNNQFIMYFSGKNKKTLKREIGAAYSYNPKGPFIVGDRPLISNDSAGGLIDPEHFQNSDGKNYILYKNDGNSVDKLSSIWIREVDETGLKVTGTSISLLSNNQVLNPENNGDDKIVSTIESPCLLKAPDGKYILFFSGNNYGTEYYFTGYAASDNLMGPYKYIGPLITTNSQNNRNKIIGPGGADIVKKNNNEYYMLLHGWVGIVGDDNGGKRELFVKNLYWKDGHIPILK